MQKQQREYIRDKLRRRINVRYDACLSFSLKIVATPTFKRVNPRWVRGGGGAHWSRPCKLRSVQWSDMAEVDVYLQAFLISSRDEGEWSFTLWSHYARKRSSCSLLVGGWVQPMPNYYIQCACVCMRAGCQPVLLALLTTHIKTCSIHRF